MNIALWVLQILLAIMFAFHGTLFLFPPPDLVDIMNEQLAPWFRIFLGIAEWLAAVGLILPGLTRIMPHLVGWAAVGISIITISASVLHFTRGEISSAIMTAVLFIMSVFVAYMRLKVKPIAPRA